MAAGGDKRLAKTMENQDLQRHQQGSAHRIDPDPFQNRRSGRRGYRHEWISALSQLFSNRQSFSKHLPGPPNA
jgi:hypothetical protein